MLASAFNGGRQRSEANQLIAPLGSRGKVLSSPRVILGATTLLALIGAVIWAVRDGAHVLDATFGTAGPGSAEIDQVSGVEPGEEPALRSSSGVDRVPLPAADQRTAVVPGRLILNLSVEGDAGLVDSEQRAGLLLKGRARRGAWAKRDQEVVEVQIGTVFEYNATNLVFPAASETELESIVIQCTSVGLSAEDVVVGCPPGCNRESLLAGAEFEVDASIRVHYSGIIVVDLSAVDDAQLAGARVLFQHGAGEEWDQEIVEIPLASKIAQRNVSVGDSGLLVVLVQGFAPFAREISIWKPLEYRFSHLDFDPALELRGRARSKGGVPTAIDNVGLRALRVRRSGSRELCQLLIDDSTYSWDGGSINTSVMEVCLDSEGQFCFEGITRGEYDLYLGGCSSTVAPFAGESLARVRAPSSGHSLEFGERSRTQIELVGGSEPRTNYLFSLVKLEGGEAVGHVAQVPLSEARDTWLILEADSEYHLSLGVGQFGGEIDQRFVTQSFPQPTHVEVQMKGRANSGRLVLDFSNVDHCIERVHLSFRDPLSGEELSYESVDVPVNDENGVRAIEVESDGVGSSVLWVRPVQTARGAPFSPAVIEVVSVSAPGAAITYPVNFYRGGDVFIEVLDPDGEQVHATFTTRSLEGGVELKHVVEFLNQSGGVASTGYGWVSSEHISRIKDPVAPGEYVMVVDVEGFDSTSVAFSVFSGRRTIVTVHLGGG